MKTTILLSTAISGIMLFSLSSNSNGPASNGNGNRTGAPGTTGNCSTGGCHAANSNATVLDSISLIDPITSQPVTDGRYVAGRNYVVLLRGHNVNGLPAFGFQVCVTTSANQNAGTITPSILNPTQLRTVNGITLLEHAQPIPGSGGQYMANFAWTAPASGSGTVTFYAMLNAVNTNGQTTGDAPGNPYSRSLTEKPTSVETLEAGISLKAFPNPVGDQLSLDLNLPIAGDYNLRLADMHGRVLLSRVLQLPAGAFQTSLDTRSIAPGLYQLQIHKDGAVRSMKIMKQ